MNNAFDQQLRKAVDTYGEEHIDIAVYIQDDKVYGFYHSEHDSFGVTDDFSLQALGGVEQLKQYENEFDALCVCEED